MSSDKDQLRDDVIPKTITKPSNDSIKHVQVSDSEKLRTNNQEAHLAIIDALTSRITTLKDQIAFIESTTSKMVQADEKAYKFAHMVVYVFLGIAAIGFVSNTVGNQYQMNQLFERSHEIEQRSRKMEATQDECKELVSDKTIELAKVSLLLKDYGEKISKQEGILKQRFQDYERDIGKVQKENIKIASLVHETITLLSIGQQRLSEQKPQLAAAYAEDVLEMLNSNTGSKELTIIQNEYSESLGAVKRPALILLCESLVQMNDISRLREVANTLAICDCPEGAHYKGLLSLYDATDERTERDQRLKKIDEAQKSLLNAITKKPSPKLPTTSHRLGNFDLIMLAASFVDSGNFRQATELTTEFIAGIPNARETAYLQPRTQAHLFVAKVYNQLSSFVDGQSKALVFPEDCIASPGTLTTLEGRSLENLLRDIESVRLPQMDEKEHKNFREFCNRAKESIRILTATPCRMASTGEVLDSKDEINVQNGRPPKPSRPE